MTSSKTWIDDCAKDGGPRKVWLLCGFYQEPLRTCIKTNIEKHHFNVILKFYVDTLNDVSKIWPLKLEEIDLGWYGGSIVRE